MFELRFISIFHGSKKFKKYIIPAWFQNKLTFSFEQLDQRIQELDGFKFLQVKFIILHTCHRKRKIKIHLLKDALLLR